MFALLLLAAGRQVSGWVSLPALVVCGSFYLALRIMSQKHVMRMATLPVGQQAVRIAAIKDARRATVGAQQQALLLEQRSLRSKQGRDDSA